MIEVAPRARNVLGKASVLLALAVIALIAIFFILFAWLGDSPNANQQGKLRIYANIASVAVPAASAVGMLIALAGLLFERRASGWSWLGMIVNFIVLAACLTVYFMLVRIASGL